MIKLNNKGITTIEVLICFVLIVILTVSMYSTVSSFNEKRILERYKEDIYSYKNLLTKEIQDDFIKIGLTHASYHREVVGEKVTYTVDCELKDGSSRRLIVIQQLAYSSFHIGGSTTLDDEFMIKYGKTGEEIEYPIPNLGVSENDYRKKVYDLSINNVLINITDDNILSIYIGFYHPELTTRYAINIVCPINFVANNSESTFNIP